EDALKREFRALGQRYFDGLPRPVLGLCPICGALYRHSFDPWGVDGLWWQENEAMVTSEPDSCPHFGVLQGAVDLAGTTVTGGARNESYLGPGVPFVIPRVLEQAGVLAVVYAIPLAGGFTAYPITYFVEERLPPGSFTQPWTRTSYSWRRSDGGFGWRVDTDPWDFDLQPWIDLGKVRWIQEGDEAFRLRSREDGPCPYAGLDGVRGRQFVQGDTLRILDPPEDENLDPFSP
ncbi:MAG: hypothetical protein KJO11_00030, partial [Gemmatimonadetes bacterium]|nr:hypothetical protein [Gemmatimonadota bacterium]